MNVTTLVDVAGAVFFVAFLVGGWFATRWRTRGGGRSKVVVSLFLLYVLGISAAVGFTRRELFPFFDWPLISGVLPDPLPFVMLVAVDSTGREWEIDYRAWQPLQFDDLDRWLFSSAGFFALEEDAQREASRYLLDRLNVARERALAGQAIGRADLLLGPAAAPMFVIRPQAWSDPGRAPPIPLTGLRWYDERWEFSRNDGYVRTGRAIRHEFQVAP